MPPNARGAPGPPPARGPAPPNARGAPGPPPARARGGPAPGAAVHDLYVKLVTDPASPDAKKSRAITLELLQYVTARLPVLRRMGIAVRVNKITCAHLQDTRLLAALRNKGIASLPALATGARVYIGLDDIQALYDRNIEDFAGRGRAADRAGAGGDPEGDFAGADDLEQYYREEMTLERLAADDDESGIGDDPSGMMDEYQRMMSHRETSVRRPGAGAARPPAETGGSGSGGGSRGPAPAGPAPARPDNVAAPPRSADPEDDEISATIARLAGDIEDPNWPRGGLGGLDLGDGGDGGLGGDDEGGNDAQDLLMERAYWARQQESM